MHKVYHSCFIFLACLFLFGLPNIQAQGIQRLVQRDSTTAPYGYSEYLPIGYDTTPLQDWPLVIFLHGLGEQGNGNSDLNKVTIHGPSRNINVKGEHYPAVVVSPQSPTWWNSDIIDQFLDTLLAQYRIDTNRVYVTGLSMGGGGTWKYGAKFPERVAAMVPICGAASPATGDGAALVDMPVWAFHNSGDNVVGVGQTYRWRDSIIAAGGNPLITIYNKNGHNAWTQTYDDPAMWTWLFNQENIFTGIEYGTTSITPQPIPTNVASTGTASIEVNDTNGTIDSVWLDLSALGMSAKVLLSANPGNIYTGNVNFPAGLPTGFQTIDVVAKDDEGNTESKEMSLLVVTQILGQGGVYFSMGINFNNTQNATGWNNTDFAPNSERTFPALVEDGGATTQFGLQMIGRWDGANSSGMNTGANSGPVPDIVMSTCWYVNVYTPTLRLTDLDPSYRYNLIFMGSRNGGGNRTTYYQAGGQTVSLDAAYNSSNTVRIDGLSPNASGQIDIDIWKDAAASYGYLNSLTVEVASSGAGAFPVEWLGFEAIAQEFDVQLNWETQHEVNNDYFEIERSADGQFFEVIGQLFPNDEGQYAYTDASPLLGNNQYRIKQIDLDGKFSFSPVRSVAFNSPASLRIRSYPNPFQERLQIERPGQQDLPMDISLYSANGQLVYSARGITQPTWTVEGLGILPKGLYYIHVFADQYHWSSSLIKADQ